MVLSATALPSPSSGSRAVGTTTSLVAHLLFAALLLAFPLKATFLEQPEEIVPVEIVPALPTPRVWPSQRPAAEEAEIDLPTPTFASVGDMIQPSLMLSEAVLADPRSAKARRQMRVLTSDEKSIQLCNLEAMAQVRAWKHGSEPQSVVAYAYRDVRLSGGLVAASGGALFSAGEWFHLTYQCDVTDERVSGFLFKLGAPIPRAQWEAHKLPAAIVDKDDG